MEDSFSGMESEQTAEENSQDEFENIEVEATVGEHGASATISEEDLLEPYSDKLLADEEWLSQYRRDQEEKCELEEDLKKRLENRVRVGDW